MHDKRTDRRSPAGFKWVALTFALLSMLVLSTPAHGQAAMPPWATGESNPEDLEISLVTFGVGDRIVEWFGHTALVVEDTEQNQSRLYNYGMFSFDSAMLVKFAMGRLWFWVGQSPVQPTYKFYKRLGRDVRIIELNLPPEKRASVAEFLANDVRPENRDYLYHHYNDNCSTRIRDIIDSSVDSRLEELSSKTSPRTLRDLTRIHSYHNPPMQMLLMFLMNDSIDKEIDYWDEMFLPVRLENWVEKLEYENEQGEMVPLAGETRIYYDADVRALPEQPLTRWPWWLLFGAFIGVMAIGVGRLRGSNPDKPGARVAYGLVHTLVGLTIGVLGLGLFVMASFTDHQVTYWNENLFLANPITFLALPLGLMVVFGSERAQRWLPKLWYACAALAVLLLPLKLLPSFDQGNLLPIAFMLPIVIGTAASAYLASRAEGETSEDESDESESNNPTTRE